MPALLTPAGGPDLQRRRVRWAASAWGPQAASRCGCWPLSPPWPLKQTFFHSTLVHVLSGATTSPSEVRVERTLPSSARQPFLISYQPPLAPQCRTAHPESSPPETPARGLEAGRCAQGWHAGALVPTSRTTRRHTVSLSAALQPRKQSGSSLKKSRANVCRVN